MSERLNILDPAIQANPYPTYARLRAMPVHQVEPNGMWAVSRYDDILAALKNPTLTSSALGVILKPAWLERNPLATSMLAMDAPRHTTLRSLVNRAFTGRMLSRLETRVGLIADVLAEQVVSGREVDAVAAFALALPAHVIGDILNLEPRQHPHLKTWSDDLIGLTSPALTPEQITRVKTSIAMMEFYLAELIAARRKKPADDMISELVQAEVNGERLTDEDLMSFCFLLVNAGLETTTTLLTHSLRVLADKAEVFQQVCAQRGRLIPQFVEEMLRWEAPVQITFRWTTVPTELGGTTIPPGETVLLILGSATHDEKHFPDPEEFRLDRGQTTNIAFGHGAHACLGMALARMEANLGLQALLMRIKGISRGAGPVHYGHGFTSRNPLNFPLIFDPK